VNYLPETFYFMYFAILASRLWMIYLFRTTIK